MRTPASTKAKERPRGDDLQLSPLETTELAAGRRRRQKRFVTHELTRHDKKSSHQEKKET
jgi:hypothetical protein